MNPISSALTLHSPLILDGAMATELERRGYDLNDPLWSAKILLEAPEAIKQVHADYFAAGSDVAITATYQATFEGFARRGLIRDQAADLMLDGVRLALQACDEFWAEPANQVGRIKPLVAASIGPYGAFLADGSEYTGAYDLDAAGLREFHRARLELLARSGAGLLACETIPSLEEAQVLAALMDESGVQGWISFSARDGAHTSHGEPIAECAAELDRYDSVLAIGVNCTPPHHIANLITNLRRATDKPIVVYPNSGEGYRDGCWTGNPEMDTSAQLAQEWYDRGARLIGGCCRTTPQQIAELAAWAPVGANCTRSVAAPGDDPAGGAENGVPIP